MSGRRVGRRGFLVAGGAAGAVAVSGAAAAPTAAQLQQPTVISRAEWGADLLPRGPLAAEEVRFLLVHHTYQPDSSYQATEVPDLLRGIHGFHTGSSKGWPDIAYNFFVDKFGRIWEGRSGSLAGPVQGSATGGNQGYSQLCCFLGDTTTEPPTPLALSSMVSLLVWLADRYGIDTSPEARVTFTSRGSNRWPVGSSVTTPTIAGHRDMSLTECPGEACYRLVTTSLPTLVAQHRSATAPTTAAPAATSSPPPTTADPASSAATTRSPEEFAADTGSLSEDVDEPTTESSGRGAGPGLAAVGATVLLAGVAALVARRRRGGPLAAPVMDVFVRADPETVALGSTRDPGGGAVWCFSRAWSDSAMQSATCLIRPAVAVAPDWWLDDPDPHWRSLARSVSEIGGREREGAPGALAVVQWHHDVLAVLLLGTARGELAGTSGFELRQRRANVLELPCSGAEVRIEFDRSDGPPDLISLCLSPDTESSDQNEPAFGGQP